MHCVLFVKGTVDHLQCLLEWVMMKRIYPVVQSKMQYENNTSSQSKWFDLNYYCAWIFFTFFGHRGYKHNQELEDYVWSLKQLNFLCYHRNQCNCLDFKVDYMQYSLLWKLSICMKHEKFAVNYCSHSQACRIFFYIELGPIIMCDGRCM